MKLLTDLQKGKIMNYYSIKSLEESIKRALSYIKDVDGNGCQEEDCLNIATNSLNRAIKLLEERQSPWISVNDELPPEDEEVIVITETESIYFAHIVNKAIAKDYDGWNIPNVAFWMPYNPSEEMKEFFKEEYEQ